MEKRAMNTTDIALPESMKEFVQKQVTAGGYSSVGEYVRDLIRADQRRRTLEQIDAFLERIPSGEPIELPSEYREIR
jgi:antitoxin ParD1/3/4